jgi:nucleoid DNA-binding protein
MATITKKDLAQQIAENIGCSRQLALETLDALFKSMRDQLIHDNRIEVRGFGALSVNKTTPKPNARNPRTGERVYIPARRKILFKPGKQLKQALAIPLGD